MHGRRSSRGELVLAVDNVHQIRRLIWQFEDNCFEKEMTEGAPPALPPEEQETNLEEELGLTIGEYTLPSIGNKQPTTIILDDVARQYELKGMHINLLPSFFGLPTEDCLLLMKEYNAVLETFPIVSRNAVLSRDQLHLRCFQDCLKERAEQWYMALRSGSLTTWAQVYKMFYNKFFLAAKARDLKTKIATFSEEDGEPFHEAWESFHILLAQVPPHTYPDELNVTSFYGGLSAIT
ncbi:hypothetical protein Dsin_031764 [Dipteronia sinensis]|uniref:Retrotransposon gag domain-containing protein n=1 Tax=Dipteronia sinensis TaxID=43782 RepID=A0AAD9ZLS7_9ROSI|nr:hypothetical protein Dsin_031764 [Dipteronia sinensis]